MLAAGTIISGYRVERPLGRGGMGAVYEATQLSLGRTVALKLLDDALGVDDDFKERFRHEGRMQAALEHPSIVTVYEAGEAPEGLFIAMRLVRGEDLKKIIRAGGLDRERSLKILRQVAAALDAAHEAGLTHRDVKPQNILVGSSDQAYLADFGITKAVGATALTQTGSFIGTLEYVAPEQIRGEAVPASDVYALAGVAFECLTGSVPFPGMTEAALLFSQLSEDPLPASTRNPELGPAVDAVLARGLAKTASERHATAGELVADLEAALAAPASATASRTAAATAPATTPATTTTTSSPKPAAAPARRRGRLAAILAALVAAGAAIGLAAGAALGGDDPEPPSTPSGTVTRGPAPEIEKAVRVSLGDVPALRLADDRYVVRVGDQAATVTCDEPAGCVNAAAGLKTRPLPPDAAYAKRIARALAEAGKQRFAAAARLVRQAKPGPFETAANGELAQAFDAWARAYRGRKAGEVRAARRAADSALDRLRVLGYD